ncbi:MAG: dTDP-4-dehydrorhamnose reductase [Acidobacteriaceae bacterium]
MISGAAGRRILITGGTGQVGAALVRELAPMGEVWAPGHAELDLADAESIRRAVRDFRPRWIVNPAAYTAVDKAESEPELAYAINAAAPKVLGEEAARSGAAVLHFSTDYVFDGSKATPYVETDPTGPLNVYGASKLAGEQALAASGAGYAIFRTSWVYGAVGKNFLLTILRLARERERLRIVGDQHGAPTWSRDLARLAAHVLAQTPPEALQNVSGVYHASGAGETSWAGFAAEAIARLRQSEPGVPLAEIDAISTEEYPTPARRPRNSRLNCTRMAEKLRWRMPDWRDSLDAVLAELRRP